MDVQILYGIEEIKKIYETSLQAGKIDFICFSKKYSEIIGDYFDKNYAPRLYNSRIVTREILPRNQGNEEVIEKKMGKNQNRYVSLQKSSESDLMIFSSRAVLISYNAQTPYAITITDKQLVANLENQFALLWER